MVASATAAYVWEDPGDSIMIQITLEVVDRLGEAVGQSVGTGPRGAEIGGILLGRTVPGNGRVVQIEDFELVPCQHLRGASYTLAPRDRETLSAQLARRRTGQQVVGFFRSHTRPGLYLDQDDFAIISRYFADPSDVSLIVRPPADGPAVGGFFFWEDGDINRRAPYRQFPFDREQLAGGEFSITDRLATAPAAPHAPARVTQPHGTGTFRLPHIPWVAVPIVAGLFLLAGLFVSQRDATKSGRAPGQHVAQAVAQGEPVLTLEAEKVGDALQLHWDSNASALHKADLGVLWITDGGQRQRRELSRQELAAGSASYTPVSPNVSFELQVFALTDRTYKSVQWVASDAPPAPSTVAPGVPGQQSVQTAAVEPKSPETGQTSPVSIEQTAPKPRAKRAPAKIVPAPTPAPAVVAHQSPVYVQLPPPLAAPVERSQPKLVGVLPPRAVTMPSAPEAEVSFEPAHGSALKRVLHKISNLGEGEAADGFVAPVPVHKVSPAIAHGQAEGSVDVKVFIDESGNVSRAQLLTKKTEFATPSLNAARQWRFTPARKHDKAVASEMILHFRY